MPFEIHTRLQPNQRPCLTPHRALQICTSMAGTDNSLKSMHILPSAVPNAFKCVLSAERDPPLQGVLESRQLDLHPTLACPDPQHARVRGECLPQACIHRVSGRCEQDHVLSPRCILRNDRGDVDGVLIDDHGPCTTTLEAQQQCIRDGLKRQCRLEKNAFT